MKDGFAIEVINIHKKFDEVHAVPGVSFQAKKVEILGPAGMVSVVEAINLRTTLLRSPTGELYAVPNEEIRCVRNFTRGKFSIASTTLKISASELGNTIAILDPLGE